MIKKKFLLVLQCVMFYQCTAYAQLDSIRQDGIIGRLSSPVLNEVSGMAVSRLNKNVFYVHNDSGDSSRFFAINSSGELLNTHFFAGKFNNLGVLDCEDIAVGTGPVKGQSYVYLADIGDNFSWRPSIQVYRFAEPKASKQKTDTVKTSVLDLTYPNGARDAETIMIDPLQKLLYIVSKRDDSVGVYSSPLNFANSDKVKLKLCGKLFFEGIKKKKWIVAGDISPDGSEVLLKSLEHVYYWKRKGSETIYQTMQRSPLIQKNFIPHGQQEAITFSPDAKGYYVMSEGVGTPIYYYTLEK